MEPLITSKAILRNDKVRMRKALCVDLSKQDMCCMQILAELMTFSRTSSPLSEGDQQHALHLLLSHACAASMPPASTSGGNTASSQDLQAQLKHVGGSDQEAVSSVVCCALQGMAQSGYADLLSSTALPHLFAAAGLPAASQAPAQAKAVHSSTTALPGQRTSEAPMHSGSRELGPGSEVSGSILLADGRAVPALAGIARASSQLREPILAAFKAGIPSALARAAAEDGESCLDNAFPECKAGLLKCFLWYFFLGDLFYGLKTEAGHLFLCRFPAQPSSDDALRRESSSRGPNKR